MLHATDHKLRAQYHVDKHVVKMILETTQLLNNARIQHNPHIAPIYRPTHTKHPCSIWTAKTSSNFEWLTKLGLALCEEYTYRYNKEHKCEEIIRHFADGGFFLPEGPLTEFVQCMPDEYKSDNAVDAYRRYYIGSKKSFAFRSLFQAQWRFDRTLYGQTRSFTAAQ